MSLSPQFLDELRARTSLSALIGKSVKLQRAGREWKACCPFHKERTPSFFVNDEKGFYHCFGCQAHGDAIGWLVEVRGLPFMDAVKELAAAAGMTVPAPDPRARERADRAAGLIEVTEAAARWFSEQLYGIEGAEARALLKRRGVSAQTAADFGLGYAPDARGKLKAALKGFGEERLVEAGLLIEPQEDGRESYDRFRGRLIIPIRDRRGRVIAFGGRTLGDGQLLSPGSGQAKYLNSPETPLFDKGRTLFNLDRAAPASRAAGRLIVVEGYMDVIALHGAGIGEAVAPLGTALTEAQLDMLWRLADRPILCFDGDAAGEKASMRAAMRALPLLAPGRSLAFVQLPPGQDPDDLVRSRGRDALEALLARPEPLVDRIWRHEAHAAPLATPEERAGLKRRLLDRAAAIGDPDVRAQYRAELMRRFDALVRAPGFRRPTDGRPRAPLFSRPASPGARFIAASGLAGETARAVLAGLARYPGLLREEAEAIAALPLPDRRSALIRDRMLAAAMEEEALDRERLATILASAEAPGPAFRPNRGLAFSFTRHDADEERARRDLVLVIQALAARPPRAAARGAPAPPRGGDRRAAGGKEHAPRR
ncbi:MAG: DNA primase, partial [Sphingomonadaceae bacterium]